MTTTTLDTTTTTLPGIFPAPDVRGVWNGSFGVDDFLAKDGCGYLIDPEADVGGPLFIEGETYDPYSDRPNVSGVLGAFTNLAAPVTSFAIVVSQVQATGDDLLAKDARGEVMLLAEGLCDPETECRVTARLDIFYREVPRFAHAALLTIRRQCFGPDDTTDEGCFTTLRGAVFRER